MSVIRVFDVETLGFEPADGVCEVATVDVVRTETGLAIGRKWSSLIDPGKPIPPEVSAIHHILDEDVVGAPTLEDVMATIMEGPPVAFAAHNAKFDCAFVNLGNAPIICTYKVALKIWFDAPAHSNQALRYWLKLPVPRDTPNHRAPGDALVTAHILMAAFTTGITASEMVKISREPSLLPKVQFGKHYGKRFEDVESGYLEWCLKNGDMDPDIKHTAYHHLAKRRGGKR